MNRRNDLEIQEIALFVPPGTIQVRNVANVLSEGAYRKWGPHRSEGKILHVHSNRGLKLFIQGKIGVWDVDTIDEEDLEVACRDELRVHRGRAILEPGLTERGLPKRDRTPFRKQQHGLLRKTVLGLLVWLVRTLR